VTPFLKVTAVRRAAKIDKSALITLLAQPIYLMALKAIIDAELLYNLPMGTSKIAKWGFLKKATSPAT
jgi:hypothetical protein